MTSEELEEQELKQQIIAELEDIAPETMRDALALIRRQKAEEDEEDEKEAKIAREEALREGTIPWAEIKLKIGL